MTLSEFRRRYVYKADKSDKWTILDAAEGPLRGDCEDFALTVLWILAGCDRAEMARMVKRGDAYLWFTHTERGIGHMMLWANGWGWIDCNHPKWSLTPHYRQEERIGYLKFKFRLWWKG